eukprot:849415_1
MAESRTDAPYSLHARDPIRSHSDRGKKKMDKLCKARRSVARSKRELRAILERMIKECEKGYIVATSDVMHYTLNLLCVPKKDNDTNMMTDIRVARHGSYSTQKKK